MSDENTDMPVSKRPGVECRLREANGEIYLPEVAPVQPDSLEFAVEVERCLPPGLAESVAQLRQNRRRGYRRYELAVILLLLGAAAGFIYWYFPAPLPSVPFRFDWQFEGERYSAHGAHAMRYREALTEFERERYEAVARRLEPVVRELVAKGEFAGNDEIFYVFFTSCGRNLNQWGGGAQTRLAWEWVEYADAVAAADPDQLQWRYLALWLRRRVLGGYDEFYRDLRNSIYRISWRDLARQVQTGVRQVAELRDKLANRRHGTAREEVLRKQLDLLEAELLVFDWMLAGGRGGAVFPDDEGGAGVASREAALALALRYEDGAEGRQFLELHRFLLETVMAQGDSYFNALYWNGARVYFQKPLQEELNMVRNRLRNSPGGRP